MKLTKYLSIFALTGALLLAMPSAEASLWPGLGTTAQERSGAFRTDAFDTDHAVMKTPYLLSQANNAEYAGKVNAVIGREKTDFTASLRKENEYGKTLGWMTWHEGMIGNYINNTQGITSIVLISQMLRAGAAHGETHAKGLTWNSAGDLLSLKDILPDLTVYDVNQCIEVTAKKKNIHLFDDHAVTELPTNFYVGKNRVVYAIYQPYDIAPYSEGVVSIAIGKI